MKGTFGKGGKIRPKTIHGLRTGQHNNPNVLRAARASGGSCEVKQVDGKRPPMRLDRPGKQEGGGMKPRPNGEEDKYSFTEGAKNVAGGAGKALVGSVIHEFAKPSLMSRGRGSILGRAAGRLLQGAGAIQGAAGVAEGLGATKQFTKQFDKPKDDESSTNKKSGGKV